MNNKVIYEFIWVDDLDCETLIIFYYSKIINVPSLSISKEH